MDKGDFFKGLVIGAVTGSILGILYAPKPGEETRSQLKDRADYLKRRMRRKAMDFNDEIEDKYEVAKNLMDEYKDIEPKKRQAVKEEFKNCIRRIKEIAEE